MIRLNNIEKVYRTDTIETMALNNINLVVEKGEFLSIMGPSGCGKSTLLNIIGLLDLPTKGDISIDEETVQGFSDDKLSRFRNQKLGFIFQSYHLINDLTVLDNVELPLLYRKVSAVQNVVVWRLRRSQKWDSRTG
jgi:putative ABC transport system ATP-binding protein